MKVLSILTLGLLLVCAFTHIQNVRAEETDEDLKTGLKYYKGAGVKQDYQEAFKWFQKAADKGDANAQCIIGRMFAHGIGVTQDKTEAFKWFQKAADQGDADAQFIIGQMYYNGEGVTENHAEAFKWYSKSADQGDEDAQLALDRVSSEMAKQKATSQ
ncbi:MAG: tetratricopeptide repeat protein [Desulfomonilaceae bacterium]